jgi:hypothetical protein
MTSPLSLPTLSDHDLLAQLQGAIRQERQATAQVIALLMEVDARKLYARQSCSSLFSFCVQVLHLSEHAAYLRIEAARTARRFPVILDRLADGSIHLTGIGLLAPHLTDANHLEVLDAATHISKRDIEQVVARLRPQPDIATAVRKLPAPQSDETGSSMSTRGCPSKADAPTESAALTAPRRPIEIKPLAPERFKVQFTVSRETHDKLRKVQDLLRHVIADGDPAKIFDRALTFLLSELQRTRCAATGHPRPAHGTTRNSRHIPAAVKREVWGRDEGRCAFHGEQGRCPERGFLEFHHVVPYARGGLATAENLELRCRTHNVYEAEQQFGRGATSWPRRPP